MRKVTIRVPVLVTVEGSPVDAWRLAGELVGRLTLNRAESEAVKFDWKGAVEESVEVDGQVFTSDQRKPVADPSKPEYRGLMSPSKEVSP